MAFGSNNASGNFIVVCVRGGTSGETFTVTDSRNTYQVAFSSNEVLNGNTWAIYYAENIGAGANTVTVSQTISATLRFTIAEYSGVATAGSLDRVKASDSTNSTAPNSGSVTPLADGELIV